MKNIENSKIMIIDDQPANLSILFEYLDDLKADIMLIQKGQEAIEIAEIKKPEIILLDIIMPEMDGFEVCKKLKENKKTADIPVIFLSGLTETEHIVKGFECGGIDYITKPVQRKEVIARISTHLNMRRTEEALKASEKRFRNLFEYSPISIWEEDFSRIKEHFIRLSGEGINDFRTYFETHIEEIPYLLSLIKVLNINKKTLDFFDITDKEEYTGNVLHHFTEEALNMFKEEMITLAEGKTEFKGEADVKTSSGHIKTAFLHLSVVPDCEDSLSRVMVSFIDITERKKSEEELSKYRNHLEELVDKRTVELKETYKKLELEIMEHVRLEGQLNQVRKLEAIGTLAGGIAHDFNNILGSIIGYTELSMLEISEENPIYNYLANVLKAGERAKDLANQILTFSRKSEQKKKLLKIKPLIKETINLLRASLPSTIEIRQNIEDNQSVIMADPTQIHQILLNLCTNGAHAMKDHGGILTVNIDNLQITYEDVPFYNNLKPGNYVRLTVSDTGHGIKREFIERIFEPYFTTKEVGEGTGLGLSVVHGIVKSYGGDIKVYSEEGKGTTFDVVIPEIKTEEPAAPEKLKALPKGTGRILLIDDEAALVDMTKYILSHLGYEVIAKTDSIKALEIFRQAPYSFDLVITDLTMPHMTGKDLAKELISIRPDIPVILTTGFSDMIGSEDESNGIRKILRKPLNMRDIAEVINNILMNRDT